MHLWKSTLNLLYHKAMFMLITNKAYFVHKNMYQLKKTLQFNQPDLILINFLFQADFPFAVSPSPVAHAQYHCLAHICRFPRYHNFKADASHLDCFSDYYNMKQYM